MIPKVHILALLEAMQLNHHYSSPCAQPRGVCPVLRREHLYQGDWYGGRRCHVKVYC